MKKVLVVLIVAIFALGMVSCKKDCVCTYNDEAKTEIGVGVLSKSECKVFEIQTPIENIEYSCESK